MLRSIFSERGLFNLIPKSASPVIALGTAARLRGWTSVWSGDIKVFVKREFPTTTGIVSYVIDTEIDVEIYKGFPMTTEFQTIADLLIWRGLQAIDSQIPWEVFAMLFEGDEPYPKENELEEYIEARGLINQYKELREECKSFYDY